LFKDKTRVLFVRMENIEYGSSSKEYETVVYEKFEDMNIRPNILRGIFTYGFENPSTIQQKAIVPIATGKDIIGQSQSGTGKTGAFTIGILNNLEEKTNSTQAIILSPTRELAEQIYTVIKLIGQFTKYRIKLCVGGTKVEKTDTCQILIGTPGRVLDMLNHNLINLASCKIFTLDEADEMLSRGFKEQIYDIFQFIPQTTQILLFSATMPADILELTKKFMTNPIHILVKKEELTLEGIKQYYIQVDKEDWKFETLIDLYKSFEVTQCVIFCNSKQKVEMIAQRLIDTGYSVSGIHADLLNRREIMDDFKTGKTRILITTDLLSRGIDVQHISLVINYDIPKSKETYIHRIGRSGRFGRKGIALNFITTMDSSHLKDIETFYNTQIEELPCDLKIN
jgi:translation initiation factor 4A